jgi:putative oxidoreductase
MFLQWMSRWQPEALTFLRIVAGFMFWEHGAQKLFGFPTGQVVPPFTMLWYAGVIEFFGGLAIALGVFARFVAFIAAGEMAVAYFTAHAPRGFWPLENRGELAVLYCGIFLVIATAGGGRLQLGSLFERGRAGSGVTQPH